MVDDPRGADAPPQESLQASGEVFSYVRQIYVDELGPAGAEASAHHSNRNSRQNTRLA